MCIYMCMYTFGWLWDVSFVVFTNIILQMACVKNIIT